MKKEKIGNKYIISFWNKVNKKGDSECWEWKGSPNKQGYGTFNLKYDGKYKTCFAHRISFCLFYGELNDLLSVLHLCDNPICVNPHHLKEGTQKENVQDSVIKNRRNQKGEHNNSSKLKESDVADMKILYSTGEYTTCDLAKEFNISQSNVGDIISGKTWIGIGISDCIPENKKSRHRKNLTKNEITLIISMATSENFTIQEIAKSCNTSRKNIYRICQANNVDYKNLKLKSKTKKLTVEQVCEIKKALRDGTLSRKELSIKYHTHYSNICLIGRNKIWKDVTI